MAAVLSNQRPCIAQEADRWDKLVTGGFRDLGLERLVRMGMEKKETLRHVEDPLLSKRLNRMLELRECLAEKEFGKRMTIGDLAAAGATSLGDCAPAAGTPDNQLLLSQKTMKKKAMSKKKCKSGTKGKRNGDSASSLELPSSSPAPGKKKKAKKTKKTKLDGEGPLED